MFKNYLTTAFRGILKNGTYSLLNIIGLAIGIACASMIFLWVEDELTFNYNFPQHDHIYRVYENQTYEGKIATVAATPGPLAAALKTEMPGLVNVARSAGTGKELFTLGDKSINELGDFTDSGLIAMLQLPFLYGQDKGALSQVHSLVIDESMSKAFFGDADPVGKTLRLANDQNYTITGVFKDLPQNATFHFHWLAPIEGMRDKKDWMDSWGANWIRTYVQLSPTANENAINKQLLRYLDKRKDDNTSTCFLFPMNDWNLRDNFTDGKQDGGRIQYVRLFTIIAWVILLIACINFMNLATARSEKRAREVGVRKVMGAGKGMLILQFIGESITLSCVAVVLAIAFTYLALPAFNLLVKKELAMHLLSPLHLGYWIAIILITGVLAGSYPAFFLSSFNPATVLKAGRSKEGMGNGLVRKILVVTQFTVSIALIIATIIIYRQIQYVKNRDLGYNKSDLVFMGIQDSLDRRFNPVYDQLKRTNVVADATLSDYPVTEIGKNTDNYSWPGKDPNKSPLITWENVDAHFLPAMSMQLAAGRNFYDDPARDSSSVIINEAFALKMGKEGRIGGVIYDQGKRPFEIVGIVKDFLYNTMYSAADPLLLYNHPADTRILSIRIKKEAPLSEAISQIQSVLKANSPAYPIALKFVDEDFDELFKTETLTEKLAGLFASLAIIISCLGLFGLAAYTAERRIKEIGIRKVLGASTAGLTGMLSWQFLQLVGVACLIAFPVSWYVLNKWLQNYAYHTTLYWWIFVMAGGIGIFIAMTTVSFHAMKAALANPAKSLRTE